MIRHNTASAAVIDEENRALLVQHRKSGLWLYPGGHIDPDEDPAQAAVREVKEEVGIEVQIVSDDPFTHPAVQVVPRPFSIIVMDVTDGKVGPHQHIDFVYACRPFTTDLTPQIEEVSGARWIPIDQLHTLNTPEELPDLFRAAACALAPDSVA